MVRPDVAFFGAEGRPAAARRPPARARPRHPGVEIVACPTIRERRRPRAVEPQRAALGRRAASARSRSRARCARSPAAVADGRYATRADAEAAALRVLRDHGVEPEYFALVDPDTIGAGRRTSTATLLLVAAARVGDVRLIDNVLAHGARPAPDATSTQEAQHAAHDAQVQDPPRDGDRLRPALRRARSRSTPTCSRPPTSASTSRCTSSTSTTAPASRPTRSPASAARAR